MTTPITAQTSADSLVAESGLTLDEHRPFDSLDAMRDAHTHLLKAFYAEGTTPAIIESAKAFLNRGCLSGKNLDRGNERLEAQRILDQWGTVLMKNTHKEIDATLAEFEGKDLSDRECPYVGLKPFGEAEHGFFFGRERLRSQAVSILAKEDFLAVLGLSGSGKSSLVFGGILPDLREGALSSNTSWIYVPPMVPGSEPLQSVVAAFRASSGLLPPEFDPAHLIDKPDLLAEAVYSGAGERSVLVIVDQFEEIFTLCEDAKIREAFAKTLLAFLDKSPGRHKVILTMRSDFEPRLASLPELQARFVENRTVLRAIGLTRDELREAIEGPAKAVGLHFHKEVIDALLKDVGDEMAALPLLQFTLRKLWDTKRYDRITLTDYNNICGAKGALAKSADEFYENLIADEQTIAKRILLRMVRLGEGLEVTSARIRRSSLYELGHPRDVVDGVIQKLDQNGLIRVTFATKREDDELEVAHEAMVRNWRRFVRWLEEDRASLLIRRRLDDKTLEWLRLGGGTAGLLDQIEIKEAQEWLNTSSAKALGFHPSLPFLVKKSQEAIGATEREKQIARQAGMRRVARLALIENLLFVLFFGTVYAGEGAVGAVLRVVGAVLLLIALVIGFVVILLALPAALPAMMSRQSRVISSSGFKRSWVSLLRKSK
jgi:Novel STAND NTPase 1